MGQSKESTMKSFAFVCLFAAAYAAPAADADAEADPALLYSSLGYGYHHPYTYGAYAPYAVPAVHSAAVKSEVKTTVHAAPVVYSGLHHAAVAAPAVYNTAVAAPVVYNTAAHVAAPVVRTAGYYANSGGAVHIVK